MSNARPLTQPHTFSASQLNSLVQRLDALRDQALQALPPEQAGGEIWCFIFLSLMLSGVGWSLCLVSWGPWALLGVCALALGRFSRWILAHHLCHRAYDQSSTLPSWLKSKRFGRQGFARLLWVDWMPTDAWSFEHNTLHHAYTNQPHRDPDCVQQKAWWLRAWPIFIPFKILIFTLGSLVWKPLYYGPNTLIELSNPDREIPLSIYSWAAWSPWGPQLWHTLRRSWLPYLTLHFALPSLLCLLCFDQDSALHMLGYLTLAEGLTNVYSFIMIVPNHAGHDLYHFSDKSSDRGEYYLRQIVSSCDYHTGSFVIDFLHGYLNYQIEHHLWPQLTMGQYRWLQPHVQALCDEFNLPYVKEPVWRRLVCLARLAIGLDDSPQLTLTSTRSSTSVRS